MRRLVACFAPRAVPGTEDEPRRAVHAVLRSCSWYEVIGLVPAAAASGDVSAQMAGAGVAEGEALEAGLTTALEPDHFSDQDVERAFLRTAAEVHPYRNSQAEAMLALRWAADAFVHLRSRSLRSAAVPEIARRGQAPAREQECGTDEDEALEIFSEVAILALDRLSLNDLGRGVSKSHADALLNALHILHLRPQAQGRRPGGQERAILDSVLAGTLAANYILTAMARLVSWPSRRVQSEWICSTIVAALGGVAFNGASRIMRMLVDDGPMPVASSVDVQGPLVQCPLCRIACPANRAIRNVRVGEAAPTCCVCTEAQSDVCLSCGHICLCQECFQRLPRSSVATTLAV